MTSTPRSWRPPTLDLVLGAIVAVAAVAARLLDVEGDAGSPLWALLAPTMALPVIWRGSSLAWPAPASSPRWC